MTEHGDGMGRRAVLGASAAGVWTLLLPSAAAAASPGPEALAAPASPTVSSALPAGYRSTTGTDDAGAIEVTWSDVTDATSYTVRYRTPAGAGAYTTFSTTTDTSLIVTGLATLEGPDPRTYDVVVAASNSGGTSADSDPVTSGAVVASGGDSVELDGTDVVHTFTAVGAATLTLHRSRDLTFLVVGGGGGGGAFVGGGGAGGQVVTGSEAGVTGTVRVTVGDGGAGGRHNPSSAYLVATEGAGSSISASDGSALGWATTPVAEGGGYGGGNGSGPSGTATGGGGGLSPIAGATGTVFSGGSGSDQPNHTGGGGAGAGEGGVSGTQSAGGRGGNGVASSITGSEVTYGGGGAGGVHGSNSGAFGPYTVSAGGSGGGGTSGVATSREAAETVRGGHGTDGLGGGGGGAGKFSFASAATGETYTSIGGDGGSGVVIVRYTLPSLT